MNKPTTRYDLGLSPLHARTLVVLLIVAAVAVGVSASGRLWFGDSVPVDESRATAAREYVDPNTAPASSLERLPAIGPTRANAIVQYRQTFCQTNTAPAFRTARDVQNVKGLGPGTVQKIAPYLTLPCGK